MCRPIPPGRRGGRDLGCARVEEAANARGLPVCTVRTAAEWLAHEQGSLLAAQPVIGLERIGDAPVRDFGRAARPFDGIRVLSFTHAVAGPTVGRTLAEQGADVLGATRPNDYEHEFIYAEANVGARSAYVDLDSSGARRGPPAGRGRRRGRQSPARVARAARPVPEELAGRYPGVVFVSVSCYGSSGPWAGGAAST